MNEVRARIKALRLEMLKLGLDAYYITGTDPHLGEYLPVRWKIREYISGFTGSAGSVVITQEEAGLWTDSRYFLQAEEQLRGSGIRLFKSGTPNTPAPEIWLTRKLDSSSKAGIDPLSVSVSLFEKLDQALAKKGILLVKTADLVDKIWHERPAIPDNEVFELPHTITGMTRREKRELVGEELRKMDVEFCIVSALDEVAWLFNLRGSDIPCNPVFTAYAVTGRTEMVLFTSSERLSEPLRLKLEREKIILKDYHDFLPWLSEQKKRKFCADPSQLTQQVADIISRSGTLAKGPSVIAALKAVKNSTELAGFRTAAKKDGVALVEFLYWLKNSVGNEDVTEYSAGRKLAELRSGQENFMGESFAPIVGYKSHGAVVHLSVNPDNAFRLEPEGILLFDSGGHYREGTTDVTRTVALGKVSERIKRDFTLVLKGMIALSMAVFPEGTRGCNLDVLARKSMWENGLNYGHGTGHGVGHFLNVHEGPVSVRQELNPVAILPGMVISNEPGLYREGEYGIRTENMMVCVEKMTGEYGKFLTFETLTLVPIDRELIQPELLEPAEMDWIKTYHRRVYDELKPLVRPDLHHFLEELTLWL